MGTITEEPKHGHIYLQHNVLGEFDKVLATSQHTTVDTFLEHLFELYTKASKTTRCVKVRPDVAQRFTALQCETRFQTSDDLMKHLLNLHLEHLRAVNNDNTKETRERSVPRKSRKSQPKRNLNHTALLDSEDSCDHVTADAHEDPWREVSVSSVESETDLVERSEEVDLSRVKQEITDAEDLKSKNSDKDAVRDAAPLCLTLHKPTSARESRIDIIGQYVLGNERNIEYNLKTSRQSAQPNWRRSSEATGRQNVDTCIKPDSVSLQLGTLGNTADSYETAIQESVETAVEKTFDNSSLTEDERLGYNYVLNSLASSPGPEGPRSNSLPSSPMQVPVQYPKSNSYIISSDDEEPEDLTLPNSEQPHNLTTVKPHIVGSKAQDSLVKYDSNANAVAINQFPNGQFISPTPIAIPQNLIFHDQQSSGGLVGEPQVLQFAQSNLSTSGTVATSNGKQLLSGNPPPLFVAGMPPLQLVSVRGPPPLTSPVPIRPGQNFSVKLPNNSPQMLVPSSSVISPQNSTPQQSAVTSPSSGGQSSDGTPQLLRRKRKRIEDTTVFRDQQEASLPFNGPNKYRFYCDVCDTGFTRKYTYNRHKCKGRVEKHYCQLCDKAYLSKYKLKDHILVKHEGQTVSCPECGKKFSSRSSMEMHKKQQHEGQFSIFCKVCGKGFNHTGHYYGHMNKHTNTKPFWCQQCGKRFYGSSYLHNHKQVCRGNNDLNYACSVCDRKFKCELYLKKHMKIHDTAPIISNPNVAKVKDEDLAKAGVKVVDSAAVNGAVFPETGQPVFPNCPDASDSNSNSISGDLMIDEGNKMDIDCFEDDIPAMDAKQAMVA